MWLAKDKEEKKRRREAEKQRSREAVFAISERISSFRFDNLNKLKDSASINIENLRKCVLDAVSDMFGNIRAESI